MLPHLQPSLALGSDLNAYFCLPLLATGPWIGIFGPGQCLRFFVRSAPAGQGLDSTSLLWPNSSTDGKYSVFLRIRLISPMIIQILFDLERFDKFFGPLLHYRFWRVLNSRFFPTESKNLDFALTHFKLTKFSELKYFRTFGPFLAAFVRPGRLL